MEDEIELIQPKDLTDFLLRYIRVRPAMYLGKADISSLSSFLTGYRIGYGFGTNEHDDNYFGKNGFITWYCNKYKIKEPSYTMMPFIDKAKNDEQKALEIYFEYLEKYQKETKNNAR